jgi:hypothetical protein
MEMVVTVGDVVPPPPTMAVPALTPKENDWTTMSLVWLEAVASPGIPGIERKISYAPAARNKPKPLNAATQKKVRKCDFIHICSTCEFIFCKGISNNSAAFALSVLPPKFLKYFFSENLFAFRADFRRNQHPKFL